MSSGYIHGGTDAREVARLQKQADFVAPWSLERFDAKPGMRVLDLATGVGAMARQLLQRWPGIRLVGADLSPMQLASAHRSLPGLPLVRANAAKLPFADRTFERVHCTWLLEHVPSAVAVDIVREVHRVLAPGGYCHFTEVDNSTLTTSPRLEAVDAVMKRLNDAQSRTGDPFIGPKLEGYLKQAGFARVQARPHLTVGSHEDPAFFQAFAEEFAEIFESLDEAQVDGALIAKAAADLRALPSRPTARMTYSATIAVGWA